MSVYIELVIADNFIITYFLGSLTQYALAKKKNRLRLAVGSFFATAITLLYPFIKNNTTAFLIKVVLYVLLSIIFFAKTERALLSSAVFLLLTFLFGGAVFAVSFFLYGSLTLAMQNQTPMPISVIIVGITISNLLIKRVVLKVKRVRDASKNIYRFKMMLLGKTIEGSGFLDTGNRLYDERNGLPVIVLSAKTLISALNDEQVYAIVSGNGDKLQSGARYISIETVGGGDKKILLLFADEFLLYLPSGENIMFNVSVGVSFSPLHDCVKYDLLLHPSMEI